MRRRPCNRPIHAPEVNPIEQHGQLGRIQHQRGRPGRDLWQAISRDYPALYWRGRADNPIASWYASVCDGMMRLPEWIVYWRGIEPVRIPEVIEAARAYRADFSAPTLEAAR